jgi:hypothetical protein
MSEDINKSKTLGDHLESLGRMSFPITGKEKVDKTVTRIIILGLVVGVAVPALGNLVDVGQIIMAGIDSALSLLPGK